MWQTELEYTEFDCQQPTCNDSGAAAAASHMRPLYHFA